MSTPFNANEAVTFDLQFGHIHLDGAPRRVMVPADALVALCVAAGEEDTASFGHAIGEAVGRRVGVRLAGGSANRRDAAKLAEFEDVINQLAGELAILGVGSVKAERWGQALVLVVDQSPFGAEGDHLMAQILGSALHALVDEPVRVIMVERDDDRARFLVVSGAVVQKVNERLDAGDTWPEVIAALHRGAGGGEA